MAANLRSKWLKALVFLACAAPLAMLIRGFQTDDLGPNPIEYITRATGDWTLRFLLATLAITPLRRTLNVPDLIRFRRMLGLYAFFYGCLHFVTWMWLDKFFDLNEMWADVVKRRFITMGMFGFVLMIPLAVTSTAGWIRRIGGKNWQRLHRLIYVSAVAAVIHFSWKVKADMRDPAIYAAILGGLLLSAAGSIGARQVPEALPAGEVRHSPAAWHPAGRLNRSFSPGSLDPPGPIDSRGRRRARPRRA